MDTFQAKIGLNSPRKRENKNYHSVPFPSNPTRNRNSKKIGKKFKKLNNTITISFQSKRGWKRMGKRENKKLSFRFVSTRSVREKFKKIAKKIEKYHYEFISCQNRLEKSEKERI